MDPKDGDNRSPLSDLPLFPDEPPRRRRTGKEASPAADRDSEAGWLDPEEPTSRRPRAPRPAGPETADLQPPDFERPDFERPGFDRPDTGAPDFEPDLEDPDREPAALAPHGREPGPDDADRLDPSPEHAAAHPEAAHPEAVEPRARPGRRRGRELPLFPGAAGGGEDEPRAGRPRREPSESERWPLDPSPDPQPDPQLGPQLDLRSGPQRPQPGLELDAPPPGTHGVEPAPEPGAAPPADRRGAPAAVSARLAAGALDLALLLAAAGLAVIGSWALEVPLGLAGLAGLAVFVAVFSFVYAVVPLAFWGRTPGMALIGITARSTDGGPLTFGQVGLRWVGGLLTLALAALPLLLALGPLGGRSLSDRLSGSNTIAG